MTKQYTIPELLGLMQIRGYSPRGAAALNKLLNAKDKISYDQALKIATQEVTGYSEVQVYDSDTADAPTNVFGLPIYHPLVLEGVPGTEASEDLILVGAIIEFNRTKDIVITKIQGQEKSVKEHINNGDYQIKVSGMIATYGKGYPFDDVGKLKAFLNLNQPISIVHEVLNAFDINEIVITGDSFPKSNFTNAQVYSFNALDDEPLIVRS